MIFRRLFGTKRPVPADALYGAIVAAARQEKFYAQWQVADTVDGRFDMMVLHMFLVLDRLRHFGPEADEFKQALVDRFFAGMDSALREMGVGDVSVGKKVRKMAEAFYGRAAAYTTAMAEGATPMAEALARNVYAGTDAPASLELAKWCLRAQAVLAKLSLQDFKSGQVIFE